VALPGNLSLVTVTGTYIDIAGNPIAGQVKFTPRAVLKNVTANIILINSTITVTLDSNGAFSQQLVATDDADASPINFTYRVEEAFIGGRTYDILLPSSGSTVDLADVSPAVPQDGAGADYVAIADYNALEARVDDIEALANIFDNLNVTLAQAITNSNIATALLPSLVLSIGNIQENTGPTSLLLPIKAS
jgi:hypothetical protein